MVKILFLIACVCLMLDNPAFSTNIECEYEISHAWYYYIGRIYQCNIKDGGINIKTREQARITSVNGTHEDQNNNKDVVGLRANYRYSIKYFPKGLEEFFGQLQVIFIYYCELKEIHQSDLKPFPELTSFSSAHNHIEVIEQGLFDYNPKLSFVEFQERNLIHIDANVFDHLDDLGYFWMKVVPCVQKDIWDSQEDVLDVIKIVKNQCVSSKYLELEKEVKKLENESKTLDSTAFKTNLQAFVGKYSTSVFLGFRPLKSKYETLKSGH
ncbi:unnamed protein product [Chironomus riparius]|uniref:Uncharacterized protein n=1 Tax=Chironomus riparius TaxID=315576 RepID=A0A9N9WX22_9DIPT|nr:unnamed protein product [Chironomus riparius]